MKLKSNLWHLKKTRDPDGRVSYDLIFRRRREQVAFRWPPGLKWLVADFAAQRDIKSLSTAVIWLICEGLEKVNQENKTP